MFTFVKSENDVIILAITQAVINFLIIQDEYRQIKEIQNKNMFLLFFKSAAWTILSYQLCVYSMFPILRLFYSYIVFRICVIFSLHPYQIINDSVALKSIVSHVTSSIVLYSCILDIHVVSNFISYLSIYPVIYTGSLYFLCRIAHQAGASDHQSMDVEDNKKMTLKDINIHLTVMR